jgi:hypothetical protein
MFKFKFLTFSKEFPFQAANVLHNSHRDRAKGGRG